MKATLTTLAIAALAMLGAAPQAEARHSSRVYISGHSSCGTPIYKERYFIGYSRCGDPIWGTRVVRSYRRPVVREVYVAPCPPRPRCGPGRYDRGYRGSSVAFHASFGH